MDDKLSPLHNLLANSQPQQQKSVNIDTGNIQKQQEQSNEQNLLNQNEFYYQHDSNDYNI